jgi:hypothetical protein
MAITIRIGKQPEKQVVEPKEIIKLQALKNLNDDVMVFDHADITIVIQPKVTKVTAYAKDVMSDYVYGAQNRLFQFLGEKGIINPESVQGGAVYSSIEGQYFPNDQHNVVNLLLLNIHEFVEEERPYFEFIEDYEELVNDNLTDPDEADSTELGEVPQAEKKGSMSSNAYSYGNSFYYQSFTYE